MAPLAPGLEVGSWTLWAFAMLTVVCRLASRRILFGTFRKYQIDDYLMILCTVTFTGVVVSSNKVAVLGSNYADDSEIATWTPLQKEDARVGSIMLIVLEQFMLATVWLVKACLLVLYSRLTNGLTENFAVQAVAVFCALGYVIVQLLYFAVWCRPFHEYWAVPVPHGLEQCKTYRHHMITMTTFHVSSDLLMLLIPVPLIIRTKLPLRRKIVLCAVFGLGLAVVIVAILNRYYNFAESNSYIFLIWYNGEASTAVMIANIPFCWTLLRKIFALDAWSASRKRSQNISDTDGVIIAIMDSNGFGGASGHSERDNHDSDNRAHRNRDGHRRHSNRLSVRRGISYSESTEYINASSSGSSNNDSKKKIKNKNGGGQDPPSCQDPREKSLRNQERSAHMELDLERGLYLPKKEDTTS